MDFATRGGRGSAVRCSCRAREQRHVRAHRVGAPRSRGGFVAVRSDRAWRMNLPRSSAVLTCMRFHCSQCAHNAQHRMCAYAHNRQHDTWRTPGMQDRTGAAAACFAHGGEARRAQRCRVRRILRHRSACRPCAPPGCRTRTLCAVVTRDSGPSLSCRRQCPSGGTLNLGSEALIALIIGALLVQARSPESPLSRNTARVCPRVCPALPHGKEAPGLVEVKARGFY